MLPVGWLVLAVVLAVLLTLWVTFTLTRLDRLHARVDAAQSALDAQLVRRAAAVLQAVTSPECPLPAARRREWELAAHDALAGTLATRSVAENALGRAVTELVGQPGAVDPEAERELREAAERVVIARRFYNDAVRDTRTLRSRRMPRLFRLAGHRGLPPYFDIDDTVPPVTPPAEQDSPISTPLPFPKDIA